MTTLERNRGLGARPDRGLGRIAGGGPECAAIFLARPESVAGLRAETLRIHGAGRVLRVRVAFQRRQMQPFHRFFRF